MDIKNKVGLVQAAFGAFVLSVLMVFPAMFGFEAYIWMLFLPLLLFFALGADFKKIPSMIVCYILGIGWAMINGLALGVLIPVMGIAGANIVAPIIVIFLILTIHENFFSNTIIGNVPALFLGLSTTFFAFMITPTAGPAITPIHLIGFFLYGLMMAVILVGGGFAVCSAIFGKETVIGVFKDK